MAVGGAQHTDDAAYVAYWERISGCLSWLYFG